MDVEIYLKSIGFRKIIAKNNDVTSQDRTKAMIFLRNHFDEGLKTEYLTVKNPLDTWNNLKERFDHLKLVILLKARYDWPHPRLQDFKIVSEHNSAIFRIISQLKLCGKKVTDKDILKKNIFHLSCLEYYFVTSILRENFEKYNVLITCFLVDEYNNKTQPINSSPFLDVNATKVRHVSYVCG